MPQIECIRGAFNESADWWGADDLWSANSYLVKEERSLYVIDSGVGPQILAELRTAIAQVTDVDRAYLINTHGHSDHSANSEVVHDMKKQFGEAHCYTHEGARQDTEFFLRFMPQIGKPMESGLAHTEWLLEAEAQEYAFGEVRFRGWKAGAAFILATPGHSPDSVVVYLPGSHALFTGDTTWYVSPNNQRGSVRSLVQSAANLRALAAAEHVGYLGHGHYPPVAGEQAVFAWLLDYENKEKSLVSEIEKVIAGKQRVSIEGGLARLRESPDPAMKEAFAINFPRLPSYIEVFLGVLLRENGWQRVERTEGGVWAAPD